MSNLEVPLRRFRFRARDTRVLTPDGVPLALGEPVPGGDVPMEDLRDCSLTSLIHALRAYRSKVHPPPTLSDERRQGPYQTNALYVVNSDHAGCALKYEAPGNRIDAMGGDRLLISVDATFRTDDADLLAEVARLAARPKRARFVRIERDGRWIGPDTDFEFESLRGATIGDAVDFTRKVQLLLASAAGDGARADHLEGFLHSGFPELLVGRLETARIEAKRDPHDLSSEAGRLELAKDVAALANSRGGVLLFGLATKTTAEGDRIAKVLPFRDGDFRPGKVRGQIDGKIFPKVRGVRVRKAQRPDGTALGSIAVPQQRARDLPFIVRGAVVEGQVQGAYVTVVQRRGAESEHLSIETLHACIRSGAGGMGLEFPPEDRGAE